MKNSLACSDLKLITVASATLRYYGTIESIKYKLAFPFTPPLLSNQTNQAYIDLTHVVISKEGLGLPNTYKAAFEILMNHQAIDGEMYKVMSSMVGFRNISVHDYSEVKPEIVKSIVKNNLNDFEKFYEIIYLRAKSW